MQLLNDMMSKNVAPFPIAIAVSRFNEEVTEKLLQGALSRLETYQFQSHLITVCKVPGAVELPLTAQRLAKTKKFKAIILLGAVIQGETNHFDYVCEQVSQGTQHVALTYDIPVIFGVLTTQTDAQALDRVGGQHGHKGMDAVDAAIEMVKLLEVI